MCNYNYKYLQFVTIGILKANFDQKVVALPITYILEEKNIAFRFSKLQNYK